MIKLLRRIIVITHKTDGPRTTKFAVITLVGRGVFWGVQIHPISRGKAPTSPKYLVFFMRAYSKRHGNQISNGDQTRCEENFYTVDHGPCPG